MIKVTVNLNSPLNGLSNTVALASLTKLTRKQYNLGYSTAKSLIETSSGRLTLLRDLNSNPRKLSSAYLQGVVDVVEERKIMYKLVLDPVKA